MTYWADWRDLLTNADIDTARLIVQLQTEDAQAITSTSRNVSLLSDADLARQLYEEELR